MALQASFHALYEGCIIIVIFPNAAALFPNAAALPCCVYFSPRSCSRHRCPSADLAILGLVGDGLLEPRLAHGAAGGVALHGE